MSTLRSQMTLRQDLSRILTNTEMDNNFINIADTVDGKSPVAGPGSSQAFETGALKVTGLQVGQDNVIAPYGYHISGPMYGGAIELRCNSSTTSRGFRLGMRDSGTGFDPVISYLNTDNIVHINKDVQIGALTVTGALAVTDSSGTGSAIYANTGSIVLTIKGANYATADIAYFNNCTATGANLGTLAGLYLQKVSASGRSINTAGTVNTSGADYAEYEYKSTTCDAVAKGQIIGFDVDGRITACWSESKSFGIKSTNPSYVGGDCWANESVVGTPPVLPENPTDEDEIEYKKSLAAFYALAEVERQNVDRIAYSGKVPCNVLGAKIGDYILAAQDGDKIVGVACSAPTFEQYLSAVGRVRKILDDGRAEIAVIVH